MKPGVYAVSIQYGGGHHFFVWTGDDIHRFKLQLTLAQERCAREIATRKRGAKPHAHGWNQCELAPSIIPA